MTEYKACIAGLTAAIDMNVKDFEVYGDSILIIIQYNREWGVKSPQCLPFGVLQLFIAIQESISGRSGKACPPCSGYLRKSTYVLLKLKHKIIVCIAIMSNMNRMTICGIMTSRHS